MKVIQLTTFFNPSIGGVERQVEEISQQLILKGIDVTVFTTDAAHNGKSRIDLSNTVKTIYNQIDPKKHFKVKRFRYLVKFGFFFRFSPQLLIKLLFTSYDVIHIHNMHDAHLIGAILIKAIKRKKLVLTGHNPFVVNKQKRGEDLTIKVKFYDILLKIFLKHIDKYIALVPSEKLHVVKFFNLDNNKVEVIPNGINNIFFEKSLNIEDLNNSKTNLFLNKYKINISKFNLIVGGVCRMDEVKGLQNLKMAVDKLENVLFIFAGGDGGYLNTLKELYKNNLNVFFTNEYIDSLLVKNLYNLLDIFLFPSLHEAFGITVVEAMTQGNLILATNVGGAQEIINNKFGETLDPLNQELWYNRINYYLNNKEEITLKGSKAINFTMQYKWDNVINKIIKCY